MDRPLRLIPTDRRSWTQTQIINEVRNRLGKIAGMRAIVLDLSVQGFTPARGDMAPSKPRSTSPPSTSLAWRN